MQRRIGPITLTLVQGSICDCRVQAIVNAANNQLWMGGGVAGAIKRQGGSEIEREAASQGPILVGEAIVTAAGKLSADHVIHAAVMGPDLIADADYIRRATLNALALARELHLTSIALPALGTGVGGFPLQECASIMFEALAEHASSNTTLESVEFVLFDRASYDAFAGVISAQ